MYPYYSTGSATVLDTVLEWTIISGFSPGVQRPILMYTNDSLFNNSVVCAMPYTVFIILFLMYKCVLYLVYNNKIITPIFVHLHSSPVLV